LLVITIFLSAGLFYSLERTFYYRGLYATNPKIKIEKHNKTIYYGFSPTRSQAYTCKLQPIDKDGVGMVCTSPDATISINCTTTRTSDNDTYFC
jgi:hypothetical protein